MEPNFIIAGGVATGTSFLSHSIKDHPQIYLPPVMRPECGFFYKSWDHAKGEDYYLSRWFKSVKNEIAIGERSSLYLHGTFNHVARRIHDIYPGMKLIFCLRNPTERAYANYRFTALTGYETLSFKKALAAEDKRAETATGWKAEILPNLYRKRGCYYEQLALFYERFPKGQILCLKSSDLAEKTEETLKRVFKFLGVDTGWRPTAQENFTSPNVKNARLQEIFKKLFGAKLDLITEGYRANKTFSLLGKIVSWNLTDGKQPMDAGVRQYLNDFYAPHNKELAKFLNWDVSDWK
ncbi:MAG: sulfotransferase [Nitrospinae bacterium]|nr:sulfotransferase [Nitrospinota bacterium]